MNSRLLILSAVLALTHLACTVPEEPSLRVMGATIPDKECKAGEIETWRTSTDLSISTSALVAFSYKSDITPQETTVNGDVVAGPNRNDILIDEIEMGYESEIAIDTEVRPAYGYIGGDEGTGTIIMDLLTQTAVNTLAAAIPPGSVDAVEVVAKLRFRGETSVGEKIESREIRYPISVSNSGFACPAGTTISLNGPCGTPGGSPAAPLECEAP